MRQIHLAPAAIVPTSPQLPEIKHFSYVASPREFEELSSTLTDV
jgi:hypothetical protein